MEVEEGGLLLDGDKVKLALKKKNAMLEPFSLCLVVIPSRLHHDLEGVREGFKNPSNGKIPLRGGGGYPPFPLTFWPAVVR